MKKITKFFLLIVLGIAFIFGFISASTVSAGEMTVLPGGQNIGLKIETGVYIAGKYEVDTKHGKVNPWRKSDLKVGDQIKEVDGVFINTNQELQNALSSCLDDVIILGVTRNGYQFSTNIDIAITKNGDRSIGLYVKDKLVGIGTITFINPDNNGFASLGHGIYDDAIILGNVKGAVLKSNIEAIKKAVPGTPGEKLASVTQDVIGRIAKNTNTGVYGVIASNSFITGGAVKVASQSEVKIGPACIYTVIENNKVGKYNVEIIDVQKQDITGVKGIKIKITDNILLEKTGGIVQGMSGSPIIQNNKIVGAVSHVTVDNPVLGYGMHIEWMINELANSLN